MARYLKQGISGNEIADQDRRIRRTVEDIIEDIDARGNEALREYSEKFDAWSPESFLLTKSEIESCYAELSAEIISDIKFAQTQLSLIHI